MIPLGSKPANVRVFKSGLGGKEMAYLMGYGDDRVWVVDLDTLQPVAEIPVGAGPYDMTAALGEGSARRGYVSCFLGHRVAVIDLDPASPYYHTRIAEIH
jgi:YVTN family beta-propeller protein